MPEHRGGIWEGWEAEMTRGREETFGGDEYVHYLDRGDVFTGAYIYKMYSFIYFKYVHFIICSLYFNKTILQMNNSNCKIQVHISQTCVYLEITWEVLSYADA